MNVPGRPDDWGRQLVTEDRPSSRSGSPGIPGFGLLVVLSMGLLVFAAGSVVTRAMDPMLPAITACEEEEADRACLARELERSPWELGRVPGMAAVAAAAAAVWVAAENRRAIRATLAIVLVFVALAFTILAIVR